MAEKIYTGEKVTEYEFELAQKAFKYKEYQEKIQQRSLRIEHLTQNPHELPIYKDFLSNHSGELKHIPIDGNILSVEQFRHWCEQKTAQQNLIKELSCGVQPHLIQILESTHDNAIVAQKLDIAVNAVLENAYAHDYLVTPEVDWRLQAALKALPKSVDPKDFTFHMATIEYLLHDIQVQIALAAHQHPQLIERSPQLLVQAVTKYFEYLAPTENEIAFMVDLARYVSDVTIGTRYLSAEVKLQRIEQFWSTVENISFESLSKVTAEQIIDSATYVAARATYALGIPEAIAVIKELAEGVRVVKNFAERFQKQFDQILQENPVIITEEGTVIANASKEALAEARQLIQAFDDMKEKPADKKPSEVLDNTKKMIEKEQQLLKEINNESQKVHQRVKESKQLCKELDEVVNKLSSNISKERVGDIYEKTHATKITSVEQDASNFYNKMKINNKDISTISNNTGIPKHIIEKIKSHLFLEEHILRGNIKRQFSLDPNIAKAWQRLIDNKFVHSDLVLLQHEYLELLIMRGIEVPYESAHNVVDMLYNWKNLL